MYGVIHAHPSSDCDALLALAREWSPRVERLGGGCEIGLDLSGLTRLFGDAQALAGELWQAAAAQGPPVRIAVAGTRAAARLMVRHGAALTVVPAGTEADALAGVPLEALATLERDERGESPEADLVRTFRQWGLRTLGDLAALPPEAIAARLGQAGVCLHQAARGVDPRPLVPQRPEERFEQALDLEWPIEGLEPLSVVLGRLLEPLSAHLERRDRGVAVLRVRLHLVTRGIHERALQLPIPLREARALRTLILLDLESHPPPAAIDRVIVAVDPTPARVVQYSLLARPLPPPEQISTLMARLHALMGETRCGSPAVVDTWKPGACTMASFAPDDRMRGPSGPGEDESRDAALPIAAVPVVALRRFRVPVVARVRVDAGRPAFVTTDVPGLHGGRVEMWAGPWRTSGGWWTEGDKDAGEQDAAAAVPGARPGLGTGPVSPKRRSREGGWDRDEWDVGLIDGAAFRIFRTRDTGRWFVDGIVD